MASSKYTRSPTIKRILREAAELAHSPSPDFHAAPANDSDIFDWHFTIRGPPSSAFSGGIYHGRIVLPPTYPLRPPSFRFLNPSGRFEVNREICLSISGHHEETWMPAWGVRTALVALRSFMETDAKGQLGGMECTNIEREKLARDSVSWTCSVCKKKNKEILGECQETIREIDMTSNPINNHEAPAEQHIVDASKSAKSNSKEMNCTVLEVTEAQEITSQESDKKLAHSRSKSPPEISRGIPTTIDPSTRLSSMALHPRVTQSHQVVSGRLTNEDSPLWIDRAIATIVICLVVMVMKILLGIGRNFSWESGQE